METIPDTVTQFIATHIDSVDLLRVLLFFKRHPGQEVTADAVCSELRIPSATTEAQLALLTSRGLLMQVAGPAQTFRYSPASAALDALVMEIDTLDQRRPVTLINLIYALKKSPAQAFADAFKFKRSD